MWSEVHWLAQLRQRLVAQDSSVDLQDDAAWLLQPNGGWLVTSTDMLVEGTHFKLGESVHEWSTPEDIGWKAAAVSLSDLAACGAVPTGLLLALGVPCDADATMVNRLYDGLFACLEAYEVPLLGGDTVAAPQWTLTSTVLGTVAEGHPKAHRTLAKPNDVVAVCGWHGLSAVGLHAIQQGIEGFDEAKAAHKRPSPLLKEAQAICNATPRLALMDTSDGLADAALKIAAASGVTITLDFEVIPIHPELQAFANTQEDPQGFLSHTLLYGGEDFGLMACMPPEIVLPQGWTLIGSVEARRLTNDDNGSAFVVFPDETVEPLCSDKTYQHFTTPVPEGSL
ncbi:MAG: thiamine-phosphate kinase [Vampirovibrionales bacterium]|nr:thiamine-phosphate kinase [Vampirovibrionales bacterium]